MNTQKQIAVIVVLFFLFVGGCAAYTVIDLPVRAVDQAKWQQEENIRRGALLFANNCRTCHGIKGQGGVGLPLNNAKFQDQDPLVLAANKTLLQRTLYCGRAGTRMPPWLSTNGGSLNPEQIQHVIDLITAPVADSERQDDGTALNQGWQEAIEFGENLNRETVVVVGGDTLATIASAHEVGLDELSRLNGGISVDQRLKKGARLNLPPSSAYPQGRVHEVPKDGETLRKLNDSLFVGAMLIADDNKIPFKLIDRLGAFSLATLESEFSSTTGLIPGKQIALPAGARYTIRAGDTIESIAGAHGVSVSSILSLGDNRDILGTSDQAADLDFERRLELPNGAVVLVAAGDSLASIAQQHGITAAELATFNGLPDATASIANVAELALPDGTRYVIQIGETLASIAADHKLSTEALASLNGLQPADSIGPSIVIQLPKVDRYTVNGQDLAAVAATFSNVTAASLGQAQTPPVPADHVYAVGTQLVLPTDAWGSAPPDTINNGTACLQYTIPESVFAQLPGISSPTPAPTAPSTVSTNVQFEGNANDWTVIADGVSQPPNQGAVLVRPNTAIPFTGKVSIHTVTIQEGTEPKVTEDPDLQPGETFTFTFVNSGTYHVTCDIHPAMTGYVFVQ